MRSVKGVMAGITLIVTFTAVMAATSPTSADPPPPVAPVETPLPVDLPVDLPVQVPDLEGLPELPVELPGISGLSDILECLTGATSDLSSPTGLLAPVQCILAKLLELVSSLLGGLGTVGPELPASVSALP